MREVTNARDKTEGDLFPHSSNSFKHRARMNTRLKSSSNRRNRFSREHERDETCANFRIISRVVRKTRITKRHKETKRASSNVPGRTPRRCTIDRRNNPSRSRPRRIKRWFRWNLSPRLRLSRLGTRPSERRFELGRGNPFVRYYYVCACVLRVEILKETPLQIESRVMRCSRVFGRRKAKREDWKL